MYRDLPSEQLDSFCRAVSAVVDMTEGPAVATLEFPMLDIETNEEVEMSVRAWRCESCDETHVGIELHPESRRYAWNKENSDLQKFGELFSEDEHHQDDERSDGNE